MKAMVRIGDSFLSIRESENEAFRAMPGRFNGQGTTMNNNVTLEQLNAPTDLESLSPLQGFRCTKSDLTYVTLAWHGPNGTQDGFVYGAASNEWLERNIEELTLGRKASRSETHEDEELMIRVKLDEGV